MKKHIKIKLDYADTFAAAEEKNTTVIREIFDRYVYPKVSRAKIENFSNNYIRQMVTIHDADRDSIYGDYHSLIVTIKFPDSLERRSMN